MPLLGQLDEAPQPGPEHVLQGRAPRGAAPPSSRRVGRRRRSPAGARSNSSRPVRAPAPAPARPEPGHHHDHERRERERRDHEHPDLVQGPIERVVRGVSRALDDQTGLRDRGGRRQQGRAQGEEIADGRRGAGRRARTRRWRSHHPRPCFSRRSRSSSAARHGSVAGRRAGPSPATPGGSPRSAPPTRSQPMISP